jgi:hypothetical protein
MSNPLRITGPCFCHVPFSYFVLLFLLSSYFEYHTVDSCVCSRSRFFCVFLASMTALQWNHMAQPPPMKTEPVYWVTSSASW